MERESPSRSGSGDVVWLTRLVGEDLWWSVIQASEGWFSELRLLRCVGKSEDGLVQMEWVTHAQRLTAAEAHRALAGLV